MKRTECDRLEDFLGGWMPDADTSEFERHLLQCEAAAKLLTCNSVSISS